MSTYQYTLIIRKDEKRTNTFPCDDNILSMPMQFNAMAPIGILLLFPRHHYYALTIICLFGDYFPCIPLETKGADEVMRGYLNNVYTRFRRSKKHLSNNGSEFKNILLHR